MSTLVSLGSSSLSPEGLPIVHATVGEDGENFGDVDHFNALGVTARPWPASDDGHAEAVAIEYVGGADAVCVGGRDARTAKVYGALAPGDSCLHSTGPEQAAQVVCKEESRTVALVTKGPDGKNIVLVVDGQNERVQVFGFGHAIEMSRDQGIVLSSGDATLQIHAGVISLVGTVVLGGRIPVMPVLGGTSPPGAPIPGVFVGI